MKRIILYSLLMSLGVIVSLFILKFVSMFILGGGGFEPPADAVNASKAFTREWRTKIKAAGTITPELGVTVRTEESGLVEEILFESGDAIKVGQVLVRLDRSVELAELSGAKAEFESANQEFSRARKLIESKSISRSEFDLVQSRAISAKSRVRSLEAKIERKEIRALFAGRAGRRLINKGEYLSVGQPIVELHSEDLFYVDFSVPQRFMGLVKEGLPLELESDVWSEKKNGLIQSVNPNIDPETRQVSVRGVLQADGKSGQFVGVTVLTGDVQTHVTIPLSSVTFAPFGDTVFVLEDEKDGVFVARQRTVRLGEKEGDQIAVLTGISEGDLVVSGGAFKLVPEGKAVLTENAKPSSDINPQVENS